MGFVEAIASAFKGYVNFRDRSCRSEYWWYMLFIFLANIVIAGIELVMGLDADIGVLGIVFSLAVFLPSIAIGVRRLHDIDKSGWWLLLGFIPLIGVVILFIWACKRGTPGVNRFGPDPLAWPEDAPKVI